MNRVRRLAILFVVAVALAVVAGWLWWALELPEAERDSALGAGGFVVALVGLLLTLVPRFWALGDRTRTAMRPTDELTDLLAAAVRRRWEDAAAERRLLTPAPIAVRWSLPDIEVTGSVRAAIGGEGLRAAFAPLPGLEAVTEAQLLAGGGQQELHAVYGGLASGRLVVVGPPGSGKTASAILLVLHALDYRDRLSEPDRTRVPVPVIFTVQNWNASRPVVARLAG